MTVGDRVGGGRLTPSRWVGFHLNDLIYLANIIIWLWLGSGVAGAVILLRNPDKRVFDYTQKGLLLQAWVSILIGICFVLGPIALIAALLIHPKKICPSCYHAIPKQDLICRYCSNPVTLETTTIVRPPNYSPEVRRALANGSKFIAFRGELIATGTVVGGTIIGLVVFQASFAASFFSSMIIALILDWLWWSYSIPRWRRDALKQGADPNELQAAGEAALLLWPKGSIFEKTEFKVKD